MNERANTSSPKPLIALGEIVGTHGVGGLLRFHPYSDVSAALAAIRTVFLSRPPDGTPRALSLLSAQPHGRIVRLKLAGIDSIEAAQTLVGTVLSAAEADLPAPAPGEFYAYRLEGLEVMTVQGGRLGTIARVFPTGANDVLVVRDGAHEYLIPVIADVVRAIDLDAGRVVIEPIAGLLE
jgi:16S rRNA processing protein RimM